MSDIWLRFFLKNKGINGQGERKARFREYIDLFIFQMFLKLRDLGGSQMNRDLVNHFGNPPDEKEKARSFLFIELS